LRNHVDVLVVPEGAAVVALVLLTAERIEELLNLGGDGCASGIGLEGAPDP
jgi:hypothetical protein